MSVNFFERLEHEREWWAERMKVRTESWVQQHLSHFAPSHLQSQWPRLELRNRQTGRTTRMMVEAYKASCAGKSVVILVHSSAYGQDLAHRFETKSWPNPPDFRSASVHNDFDNLGEFFSSALHRGRTVFVDHAGLEQHFAEVLWHLHRFDLPYPAGDDDTQYLMNP